MNIIARFAEIKARLQQMGFRSNRWPDLLDSPKSPQGFLRVVLFEGDERIQLVRFDGREFVLWELHLALSLPTAVFDASLAAACADAGVQPKTYRARLNGRPVRVTVPA